MTPYETFDRDVEVNGRTVLSIVEKGMGRFSDAYRERAIAALAEAGIRDPSPDEWYPQQAWLDAFETIATDLQPHVLDRLGEQLPDVADWPQESATVSGGLRGIDEAYRRNHRGGEIGEYRFERIDERAGEVTCHTPYPCPFDRGLIRGVATEHAPVDSFVFIEETGPNCRREGGEACTYTVYW